MSTVRRFGDLTQGLEELLQSGFPETVSMHVESRSTQGAEESSTLESTLEQTDAGVEGRLGAVFDTRGGVQVQVARNTRGETHLTGRLCVTRLVEGRSSLPARIAAALGVGNAAATAGIGAHSASRGASVDGVCGPLAYRLGLDQPNDGGNTRVSAEAAVSAQGWSIGARVGLHTGATTTATTTASSSPSLPLTHADVVAAYVAPDFTASVTTADFGRTTRFGFLHAPPTHPRTLLAAHLVHTDAASSSSSSSSSPGDASAVLTLAAQIPLPHSDHDALKIRADTLGRVDVACSLRLHPSATLVLASSVHTAHLNDPAAHRVGAAVTFAL